MPMEELLECKHPTAWIEFEKGLINEVYLEIMYKKWLLGQFPIKKKVKKTKDFCGLSLHFRLALGVQYILAFRLGISK